MSDRFSASDATVIDRDNRNMAAAGIAMSQVLNDMQADIDSGNIGITADAVDVDAVAKGAGVVAPNPSTTSGLTFGYAGGLILVGQTVVTVAAGTLTLSASATNYVQVDGSGTVTSNTSGFTAGQGQLFIVTTGGSTISATTYKRVLHAVPATSSIVGTLLSTPGKTKEVDKTIGTIATSAGSTVVRVRVPKSLAAGSKLTAVSFYFKDALAANDTNYLKFGVVNLGAAGAGSQVLVDITNAANSTKATGGTALAAKTPRDLTLVTLSIGTERDVTGGDELEFTITAVGTLANTVTECGAMFEFSFTN